MIDLKRTKKEKAEEAKEMAPDASSQPDYGYGLCLHLEDWEIEKLGIKQLPEVGDEYHIQAVAYVRGVSSRDYGENKEAGIDLQITMMEVSHEAGDADSVAEEEAENAERSAVGGKTILHNAYRGKK